MLSSEDLTVWEELKKSISSVDFGRKTEDLPPRLKVKKSPQKHLSDILDLHKMTLEEAYQQTLVFIKKHYQIGSKRIQIITGKGREGKGLIHNEFMGWLETCTLKRYIREAKWTNDNGAVELWLKKNK